MENRRTADALGKYKGVGDLPRFTTDAINTNGEKAVHEVADLIGQVHDRDPAQAKELFDKTAQGIAPENRACLQQTLDGHIANRKAASQTTGSPDAGSPSTNPATLDIGAGLKDADGSETLSISIPVPPEQASKQLEDDPTMAPRQAEQSRPVLNNSQDRINALLGDTAVRFTVQENPDANDQDTWYTSNEAGKAAEGSGVADSIFPMNINPKIWSGLGMDEKSAFVPSVNIRTGAKLLARIRSRIVDPTPAKTASVWNFAGREKLNDFGAYVGRIYKEQPWKPK